VLRIQSRICIGGPALNTILLSAHLNKEKYETLLVGGRLQSDEKSMAPLAEEKGVTVEMIHEMGRSLHWADDVKALLRMIGLIRKFKPHIVHTHTAKAGAIGRVAAFLCRVPIRVHTFHGHTFHGYFSRRVTQLVILVERILARLSQRIVVISQRQKEDICEVYKVAPAHKTTVVPLGFELDKVCTGERGNFRRSLGLDEKATLVAILARLVPIKNHELLLRGIGHWQSLCPTVTAQQVRFLLIGDGDQRPRLEALCSELGIDQLVLFTGWRREVADIYADINLNVLVSKNEGTPVTLIEGLANGIPLLSTDVGGIRDFADEHCGTILPADVSAEELGKQLARMLPYGKAPERLAESVRLRIKKQFGVERLVADMESLYGSLSDKYLK